MDETEYQQGRPSEVEFADFAKLEVRVGRVLAAEPLEGARKPAFRLRIDFGPSIGIKQSSAQVTVHYRAEDLVGQQVLAVLNFLPRRVAGFRSEVLTLGVPDVNGNVVLVAPTLEVPLGGRLY